MIENYIASDGYSIGKLKNDILLIPFDNSLKNYTVDNGKATVHQITANDIFTIEGRNVQYTEEMNTGERYSYKQRLTLSVRENYSDIFTSKMKTLIQGKWIVLFESAEGEMYAFGLEFPVTFSYSYSFTDTASGAHGCSLTFSTQSNVPLCVVEKKPIPTQKLISYSCMYSLGDVDELKLCPIDHCYITSDGSEFTRLATDGMITFSNVQFNSGSFSFSEKYEDGKYTSQITFSIMLRDFRKTFWAYNLTAFTENRYIVSFRTSSDNIIASGTEFGYTPTYTITTSTESNSPNIITITLNTISDESCVFSHLGDKEIFIDDKTVRLIPTSDIYMLPDGSTVSTHKCLRNGLGIYTLLQVCGVTGQPTGKFWALEGEDFEGLDIVRRYVLGENIGIKVVTDMDKCGRANDCGINTDLAAYHNFTKKNEIYSFYVESVHPWKLTNLPVWLASNVTSGNEGKTTVILTSNKDATDSMEQQEISIETSCGNRYSSTMTLSQRTSWFISNTTQNINAAAQTVTFTLSINTDDISISPIQDFDSPDTITLSGNNINVGMNANQTENERIVKFGVFNRLNSEYVVVTVKQGRMYFEEREDTSTYVCDGGNSYYRVYKYYGYTPDTINKRYGDEYTKGSLRQEYDTACLVKQTEWRDTLETVCSGSKLYAKERKYERYTNGLNMSDNDYYATPWQALDEYRTKIVLDATSPECDSQYTWKTVADEKICMNGSRYVKVQKYKGNTPMGEYSTGNVVNADDSECMAEMNELYPKSISFTMAAPTVNNWGTGLTVDMMSISTEGAVHINWGFGQTVSYSDAPSILSCRLKRQGLSTTRKITIWFDEPCTELKWLIAGNNINYNEIAMSEDLGLEYLDLGYNVIPRERIRYRSIDLSNQHSLRYFAMPTPYFASFSVHWPTDGILDKITINDGEDTSNTQQTASSWIQFLQTLPTVKDGRYGIFDGCPVNGISCSIIYSSLSSSWLFDESCCLSNGSRTYLLEPLDTATCNGTDKWTQNEIKYREYKNGKWSIKTSFDPIRTQLGHLLYPNSTDCGYVDTNTYKWIVSNRKWVCVGTDSYYIEEKYRQVGDNWELAEPYESRASSTVRKTNDEDCGYIPPVSGRQYRWIDDGDKYICDDESTKYQRQKRQYSIDNGITWYDVKPPQYQKGRILESNSYDCGYHTCVFEWREDTRPGAYICNGTNKYNRLVLMERCDGKWKIFVPEQYRQGETLIAHDSEDCR